MKWLSLLIFTVFFFFAGFLWQQRHYAYQTTEVVDEERWLPVWLGSQLCLLLFCSIG
jgi:uncharacterized membrane protein